MDYKTLGENVRKYRLLLGLRQEELAEKCHCSNSHIAHIENGVGKPSLEMIIIISNSLDVTVDQLLSKYYNHPEIVYLREIAQRIEKYDVEQRILVCESFGNYLDTMERFADKD
ncbi:MAG: helix-turn-helix transcriptional regulator [Eubacteriales bacterium]|nr:helix-turn-helix transcriptional regulator [Eubacteriales bacterium]